MTTTLDTHAVPPHSRFSLKLALAAGIAALGDWLLYDHEVGLSLVLFLTILAAGSFLTSLDRVERRDLWVAAILLFVALLPLVEAAGPISVAFGVVGTALAAVVVTGGLSKGWAILAASTQRLLLTGAFRLFADLLQAGKDARSRERKWLRLDGLAGWIVPVSCSAIFIALFATANPLIEQWLSVFDPSRQSWTFDAVRVFVWVLLLAIAWPYLSVRLCERPLIGNNLLTMDLPRIDGSNRFFGSTAILRSLLLFNALFAVQTILDAVYLWGGASLPEGMTYATYAHRGAYPLIVTALLAAAFVLAAMRPGGAGERSPLIRRLVYLWVGQNVLLVISSILRLDLYVDVYSLTLLRVAAFIWMLLVAVGLLLVVARIALRRSNGWLIGANGLALALTLYACSFVNFAAVIANHNLSYRREAMPTATRPDFGYICGLGPHVIPALDRYIARHGFPLGHDHVPWCSRRALAHAESMENWRSWTFRDWRLQRYLGSRSNVNKAVSEASETPGNP
jgi:Domain of unknown function (DUF4173)